LARIPSILQAGLLWIFAVVLVIGAGLLVGAVAALVAIGTGLPPERAMELLFLDPTSSPLVTSATWISISSLTTEAVLALLIWRFLRRHRIFLHEVCPLGVPSLRDAVGSLLCVFGLSPLSELLAELTRRQLPRDANNAETLIIALTRGVTPLELVFVVAAAALVPAFVEELFFRGLLTRGFLGRSNLLALCVPSLMFGLFHLEPTQAAGAFVLGVGFGIARLYTDSVLTSILCHLVYNAYVLIDVYAGGRVGSTELHYGRVGLGLSLSAIGFGLMVLEPSGRGRLR
jgi:membrane protease YdiL (CAAX protease family)